MRREKGGDYNLAAAQALAQICAALGLPSLLGADVTPNELQPRNRPQAHTHTHICLKGMGEPQAYRLSPWISD